MIEVGLKTEKVDPRSLRKLSVEIGSVVVRGPV